MQKRIFHNIWIKVLSLLIAVLVWWAIVNVDNPLETKTFSGITVELTNTNTLTDKGYIYTVLAGNMTAVTVKAPTSVINELKTSDFKAVADVTQFNSLTDSVPIQIVCVREDDLASQIIEMNSKVSAVKLGIDNKESVDFMVGVDVNGTPGADYYVGEQHISPATIKVTGAASIIDRIARVALSYDITGMTSSVSEKLVPIFYDADGKVIDASGLELSRQNFTFTLEILPSKWINVWFNVSGEPADGYVRTGIDTSLYQVKIAGTKDNLANISTLDIPANAVDITGITQNTEYTLNLASYLSSNYKIVSDSKELKVTVYVEPKITKKFTIDTRAVRINNLAEKLDAYIKQSSITISVSAIEEVVNNFNIDALNTCVDMKGLDEGEHELIVHMSEGENFSVEGTYTLTVIATNKDDESKDESESDSEKDSKKK